MQPCCMSTHSQSRPVCAIISADRTCGMERKPPTAVLPSRQSFLTRLMRMFRLLGDGQRSCEAYARRACDYTDPVETSHHAEETMKTALIALAALAFAAPL